MDLSLKDKEKIINSLKKQLSEKDISNMELKQELNDISAKFKNLNIKLSSREDELRKAKQDFDTRHNDMSQEKLKVDEKLKELIDVVKQQAKELNVNSIRLLLLLYRISPFKINFWKKKRRTCRSSTPIFNLTTKI